MTNEPEVIEENENENQNYIDTINQLKANSVDKSKYDKLKAENKQLLDTLVNGGQIETAKNEPSYEELLNTAYKNPHASNLDFWKAQLALRDMTIQETGNDPFLGSGNEFTPDALDSATVEKNVAVIKELIEYADGNAQVFDDAIKRAMPARTVPFKR